MGSISDWHPKTYEHVPAQAGVIFVWLYLALMLCRLCGIALSRYFYNKLLNAKSHDKHPTEDHRKQYSAACSIRHLTAIPRASGQRQD